MYRFPWYLTLVSTNHASSNPGQSSRIALCNDSVFDNNDNDNYSNNDNNELVFWSTV